MNSREHVFLYISKFGTNQLPQIYAQQTQAVGSPTGVSGLITWPVAKSGSEDGTRGWRGSPTSRTDVKTASSLFSIACPQRPQRVRFSRDAPAALLDDVLTIRGERLRWLVLREKRLKKDAGRMGCLLERGRRRVARGRLR